ncbi:hypothetical protein BKA66DRAFT_446197 [Pyrenochaeta sp. MPI-SDFR-AT-0127]|nr:hypothetical protein BKA66DRAFT_446197 [Pyrenochaeta sp. MPI-SDFR-AT-0127]
MTRVTDLATEKIHHNFGTLFKTVKISLCQISIDTLEEMTRGSVIANQINDLTIGTKTLDQYQCDIYNMPEGDKSNFRTKFEHTLPVCADTIDFRCLGRAKIRRLTGIDLYSNGPYYLGDESSTFRKESGSWPWDLDTTSPDRYIPNVPASNRRCPHAAIFTVIHDLGALGKPVALDLVIRAFAVSNEDDMVPELFNLAAPLVDHVLKMKFSKLHT